MERNEQSDDGLGLYHEYNRASLLRMADNMGWPINVAVPSSVQPLLTLL